MRDTELQIYARIIVEREKVEIATGLSYSDVEKLTSSAISTGIDGKKWIFTTRTKTDTLRECLCFRLLLPFLTSTLNLQKQSTLKGIAHFQ